MTRGRCGSLRLHRMTLSFTTPRRFSPAHKEQRMRGMARVVCTSATLILSAAVSQAQTPTPSDVYHVMFVKAAPGQAAALAKELLKGSPKSSGHLLLLRH